MTDSAVLPDRSGLGPDPRSITTGAELAAGLTELRMRAGLSIRDVARRTGIPPATLGGYFSGRHVPPATQPQLYGQMLAALGVVDPGEQAQWREALLRARAARSAPTGAGGPTASRDRDRDPAGASPYRGLEAFTEDDATVFFGREAVADDLVATVERGMVDPAGPGMVVVVGPSGSGKSSVLRAGLVPRLRAQRPAWAVGVMVPGADPVAALGHALSDLAGASPADGASDAAGCAVLVVDQLEEAFSPEVAPEQRREFLRALVAATLPDPDGSRRLVVAASLRADFYGEAASDPDLLDVLRSDQVLLGAMAMEDLRRAIVRPAEVSGLSVDAELVDLLLRDVAPRGRDSGYDAGALPLVSHALLATWQRHRGDRLSVADYVAAGGIDGAVQQSAEAVVAGLDAAGQAAAQWLFAQLVVVDGEGVMTRRRVRHDELHHPDPRTDLALDHVIESFIAGRLLTAGDGTLEISHEALLSAWPRLRSWVLSDLDAARLQGRIADAARVWRERDHDPAALLRGGLLQDARALAAQPTTSHRALGSAELEFVAASASQAASERAVERARTRRLRMLVAIMTSLALVAGLLAAVALRARNEAADARDDALSRQLAIAANDLRAKDPALAAQLALAAYRASPTLQATSSLLDSTGVATPTRIVGPVGEMNAVASPDGRLLAISGVDGTTALWRREAAEERGAASGLTQLDVLSATGGEGSVYASAFSPDGALLAVGNQNGALVMWDVRDPVAAEVVASVDVGGTAVLGLAFSADGTQIAAATAEPSVRRWAVDGPDGSAGGLGPVGGLRALEPITDGFLGTVKSVAFSTAGVLATGSADGAIRLWSAPVDGPATLLGEASVGEPTNFVHAVAFSPDGALLASAEKGRFARLWDVSDPASPTQRGEPLGDFGSWVNGVAFSPDGRQLAAGSSDGSVQVFAVEDGQLVQRLPNPATVSAVQYLGDGSGLLTSEIDGIARIWPIPGPVLGGFADTVWAILPNEDGSRYAVAPGAGDGTVHLFERSDSGAFQSTGRLVLPDEAGAADGAAGMSRDGRWIAAGTATGRVAVWERTGTGSPRLAGVVSTSDQLVESVAVSADGALMAAVADDGAVGVWVLEPGAEPRLRDDLRVPGLPLGVTFSPDGSLLAVGTTDAQVHLWSLAPDAPAEELPSLTGFDNYVYGVAFAPSGQYLAAGSTDRTLRIFDLADPSAAVLVGDPVRGPTDTVYALSWGAQGDVLAGASKGGAVWLWDVSDVSEPVARASLAGAGANLYSVSLGVDGTTVSAGSSARTVVTWLVDPEAAAATTCARSGSGMSEEEWEQLAPGVAYDPPCPVSTED